MQPYRTKEGEGGRKEEGPITGKGERGWSCVVVGPGRTQAGSGSGEDGTLPGPRLGHSIDIPDTGFPVLYEQERGGFAFAIQPHREVRPGSGLVGIVGNTYK